MPQINPFCKVDDFVKLLNSYMKGLTEDEYLEYLYPIIALRWMEMEGIMRSSLIHISSNGYKDPSGKEYLDVYKSFFNAATKLPQKTIPLTKDEVERVEAKKILKLLHARLGLPPKCDIFIDFRNWVGHGAYYDFDLTSIQKKTFNDLTTYVSVARKKMNCL